MIADVTSPVGLAALHIASLAADDQLGERIVDLVLQGAGQLRSSAYFDNQ